MVPFGGCDDPSSAVIVLDASTAIDATVSDVSSGGVDAADASVPAVDAGPDVTTARPYWFGFEEVKLGGDSKAVTELRFIPGTADEFLLLEKDGRVLHYRLQGDTAALLGTFTLPVETEADCGLLSLAFDPDFVHNRNIYFGYCITRTHNRISRHVFDPTNYPSIVPGQEIITAGDPTAKEAWHNVGSMGFDASGYLWAVFGEKELSTPAQDMTTALGSLVRIQPNPDGGAGYLVPPSNPYAADGTKNGAIYAKGLRSPWRASLDSKGRWFIGDVGNATAEEVDMVSAPAQNFGWPMHEGNCAPNCGATVGPLVTWDRSPSHPLSLEDPRSPQNSRRVAWVGPEYRDRGNDRYGGRLTGRVLYGEFCSGWVRAIDAPVDGGAPADNLIAHLESITSWDQGPDGYLYAVTYGSCFAYPYMPGQLWRLRP